jgi:hypothetical protein
MDKDKDRADQLAALEALVAKLQGERSDALSLAAEVALGTTHSTVCSPETLCVRCERDELKERVHAHDETLRFWHTMSSKIVPATIIWALRAAGMPEEVRDVEAMGRWIIDLKAKRDLWEESCHQTLALLNQKLEEWKETRGLKD